MAVVLCILTTIISVSTRLRTGSLTPGSETTSRISDFIEVGRWNHEITDFHGMLSKLKCSNHFNSDWLSVSVHIYKHTQPPPFLSCFLHFPRFDASTAAQAARL